MSEALKFGAAGKIQFVLVCFSLFLVCIAGQQNTSSLLGVREQKSSQVSRTGELGRGVKRPEALAQVI